MAHTISEAWKRDHLLRQLAETALAWAAVLTVAGAVFAGLYFGIATVQ